MDGHGVALGEPAEDDQGGTLAVGEERGKRNEKDIFILLFSVERWVYYLSTDHYTINTKRSTLNMNVLLTRRTCVFHAHRLALRYR